MPLTATTGLDQVAPSTDGGFFQSILGSLAMGYGSGLATRGTSSGRQPGAEQFTNTVDQPAGLPGQPGTTPAVVAPTVAATLQKALPWLLIAGGVIAAVVIVKQLAK